MHNDDKLVLSDIDGTITPHDLCAIYNCTNAVVMRALEAVCENTEGLPILVTARGLGTRNCTKR